MHTQWMIATIRDYIRYWDTSESSKQDAHKRIKDANTLEFSWV